MDTTHRPGLRANRLGIAACDAMLATNKSMSRNEIFAATASFVMRAAEHAEDPDIYVAANEVRFLRCMADHLNALADELTPPARQLTGAKAYEAASSLGGGEVYPPRFEGPPFNLRSPPDDKHIRILRMVGFTDQEIRDRGFAIDDAEATHGHA